MAVCFRIGAAANISMYAETFYLVVKDFYFSQRQNRGVDDLLVTLLKVSRDKAFEELIKLEKGKLTHRLQEVLKDTKKQEMLEGYKEIEI